MHDGRRRRLAVLAAVLATVAMLPGAAAAPAAAQQDGDCSFPATVTDATGREVTIEEDPERVVTTNPSAAQTMWEIGAQEEVVGVSQFAAYLEGADAKANVSGSGGPSVERIVDLEPDLVLVPNTTHGFAKDRIQQLRDAGIPVYVFGTPTSVQYVIDKTRTTGRLTGNCEAADERADRMEADVARIERAVETVERPVGLNYFFGFTSGSGTFIGEVMETSGVRNGAAEADISGFSPINEETVVQINPAWIVVPEESSVPNNDAYNSTTAVQEGQIIRVDTNNLQQPAPRVVEAMITIVRAVHPEAYEQAELTTTTTAATEATETADTATTTAPAETTTTAGQPGFTVGATVAALVAVALLARRAGR
jgi:iron complex transport system substrate-binding protein